MSTTQQAASAAIPRKRPKERGNGVDPRLGEMPPEYAALDGDAEESDLPTLAEVGKVLPIGHLDQSGSLHQEFELVDWDWELEERVGGIVENDPGIDMGSYIAEIVGHGVARLGEIEVSKLKRSQRRLLTSQMHMDDVLAQYVWIRIGALGSQLRLEEFDCDCCRRPMNYVGDLLTLEVKVAELVDGKVPTKLVVLPRPFEYGGVKRKAVTVGPLRWSFMETADNSRVTNPAKMRTEVLRHGIVSVEGAEDRALYLTPEHLKQIGLEGVNKIVNEIDTLAGGLVMQIEAVCPRTRRKFRREINWSYNDFFGRSSR